MSNYGRYLSIKALSFLLFTLPIAAVIAYNYESIAASSTRFSLYFYVGLMLVGVEFIDKFVKIISKNPALVLSIALFITSAVMRYFADELLVVSIAGMIGGALSHIFKEVERVYYYACFEVMADGGRRKKSEEVIPLREAIRRAYF